VTDVWIKFTVAHQWVSLALVMAMSTSIDNF